MQKISTNNYISLLKKCKAGLVKDTQKGLYPLFRNTLNDKVSIRYIIRIAKNLWEIYIKKTE